MRLSIGKYLIVGLGIGVIAGILSGLVGIGGGVVIVPALAYFAGFDEKLAQGTSLAVLLPPSGALAFWHYYRTGNVDLRMAALISSGCSSADGWAEGGRNVSLMRNCARASPYSWC